MASGSNRFSISWFGGPIWAKRLTSNLDREAKRNLDSISRHRQYSKGDTVFAPDVIPNQIVVLEKGSAEIEAADENRGRRAIAVGEVLGMTEILAGVKYGRTLRATSDCEMKIIEREDLITYLHNTPDACYRSLEVIADKLETSRRKTFENV